MVDLGFFVVLLPPFLKEMNIPSAMVKHISKQKQCIKTAKLVSPSEESWHVHVYRKNEGAVMYFGGRTWLEFVRVHNLKLGYFLVFSYRGDMIFHFRAYDLTTCEITSYFKSNDAQGDQKDNGIKVEAEKHVEVKEEMESYDEIGHVKKRKLSNPISLTMKKKALKDDYPKPVYEVTICNANLTSRMNIPWRFSDTYGLSERKEIALKDPEDRIWHVHLLHHRIRLGNTRNVSQLGTPWRQFFKANNLEVGDVCIFKMSSNNKTSEAVMEVEIRRVNES